MATSTVTNKPWKCERVLGCGGFGIVSLWVHTQTNQKLAIKKCKWTEEQLTPTQKNRWIREVTILNRLQHPNIVRTELLPPEISKGDEIIPLLCMEYCKNGDLRRVLNMAENCCGLKEPEALKVMRDVSSAIEYLHNCEITHRDLKPENVVLQSTGLNNKITCKLIDLGFAKELGYESTSASIVGSLNYVAPELLWKEKYNCSVDYWSLGILFYEILTGTRPFLTNMQCTMKWMHIIENKSYDDICIYENDGNIVAVKDILHPTDLSRCTRNEIVEWLKVVLQWDPKKRGKCINKDGVPYLGVFQLLKSIFSKKILYVFCASLFAINTYEVNNNTTIIDLQHLIEKDANISVGEQILTDYYGNILNEYKTPILSKINNSMLFVFKSKSIMIENIPKVNIPSSVQRIMEQLRNKLDFATLNNSYCSTIFVMRKEIYLFQLFLFALSIKVDLINSRFYEFNKNMEDILSKTSLLAMKVKSVCFTFESNSSDDKNKQSAEKILEKVNNLLFATNQIKRNFIDLYQENNSLRSLVQNIDSSSDLSKVYGNALDILKSFKECGDRYAVPVEMAEQVFEFLKIRAESFCDKNIVNLTRKMLNLENKIHTLVTVFESVVAMTDFYEKLLEKIHPSVPSMKSNSDTDIKDDLVYDSIVMCYTMEHLMIQIRKKCEEILEFKP